MDYSAPRWVAPRPSSCPNCALAVVEPGAYCIRCGHDLISGLTRSDRRRKKVKCIYCNIEGKRSVEDIFPSWLARNFTSRAARPVNTLRRAVEHIPFRQPELFSDPAPRGKKRESYKLTTDVVCQSCNNRWMSRLQSEAKPILLRLIDQQSLNLSVSEQLVLSRWAAMTFTNIGFAERQPSTEQHQRTALLKGDMPEGWRIGIGLISDENLAGAYERFWMAMPISLGDKPFTNFTCGWFAIENIIFGTIHALGEMTLAMTKYTIGVSPVDYLTSAGLSILWPSSDGPWVGRENLISLMDLSRLRFNP